VDRPLICPDWEVQGLLAGRIKLLWRPVQHCKEFPDSNQWPVWYPAKDGAPVFLDRDGKGADKLALRYAHGKRSPFGVAGDTAWIRETWRVCAIERTRCADGERYMAGVQFKSGGAMFVTISPDQKAQSVVVRPGRDKWRSSSHMPRWASRLSVLVESVRPLRVQSATEEDARLSGLDQYTLRAADESPDADIPRRGLAKLWDARIARRPEHAWERNPWAWCANVKVQEVSCGK